MIDPLQLETQLRTSLMSVSMDAIMVLSVLALATSAALTRGKEVLLTVLVALYPATMITELFPHYGRVSVSMAQSDTYERLAVFLVATLLIFLILRKYLRSTFQLRAIWRFIESFMLGVSITGLFFAALFNVVHIETIYDFSVVFYMLFATPAALFGWLLVPIVSIPLFVRP